MKKLTLYALVMTLLLFSCSMEKRIYRNGWYVDRHSTATTKGNVQQANDDKTFTAAAPVPTQDTLQPSPDSTSLKKTTVDDSTNSPPSFREFFRSMENKVLPPGDGDGRPMRYSEARRSMKDKGCPPNQMAQTVYFMAWASIAATFLGGAGILLAIITLILSIFAMQNVYDNPDDCVDENIAIIKAARRIALIYLLAAVVAGLAAFVILLWAISML
ncbi:MAG TPA: hypothetical protein VFU15_16330 [Bacteroidia bacterium]|nr:hypothetical protein [Bacteroidia bacterium]